jgi:hypothetical protein
MVFMQGSLSSSIATKEVSDIMRGEMVNIVVDVGCSNETIRRKSGK